MRLAPPGSVDLGPVLRLPRLPRSDVVLHSNVADPHLAGAIRTLAAAFRTITR